VQDGENRGYRLRITPYRTTDNRIEAVVHAFLDRMGWKRSAARPSQNRATKKSKKKAK